LGYISLAESIINHFYVMGLESYRVRRNRAK